jgi:hypothetical protein
LVVNPNTPTLEAILTAVIATMPAAHRRLFLEVLEKRLGAFDVDDEVSASVLSRVMGLAVNLTAEVL